MSQFSGRVLLGDLDDFISPSQTCTTGVFSSNATEAGKAHLVMEDDLGSSFGSSKADVIRTNVAKVASVSLADCLACSGCVTSAETVLVQQQSVDSFIELLKVSMSLPIDSQNEEATIIAMISRPSCVSLADRLGISVCEAYERMESLFYSYGVDIVVREDLGDFIAIAESLAEFDKRKSGDPAVSPLVTNPSYAFSKNTTLYPSEGTIIGSIDSLSLNPSDPSYTLLSTSQFFHSPHTQPGITTNAPFLTGYCPGLVCYVEKKFPRLVSSLSTTRSSQQIMAALLRRVVPGKSLRIVAMASCFDRKLEASRRDFREDDGSHEVDCVLSTQEVFSLLSQPQMQQKIQQRTRKEVTLPIALEAESGFDDRYDASGGMLTALTREMERMNGVKADYKEVRNKDYVEVTVKKDDAVVFRGAYVYGFRNIQNLVMKIKRGKCNYDAVEVMACPSGCLNGGGQIRPEKKEDMMKIADRLAQLYEKDGVQFDLSKVLERAKAVYDYLGIPVGGEEAYQLFHTRYHV
ncbi:hypothetical protein WA538_003390, partial [Blastocystis sp. DL]